MGTKPCPPYFVWGLHGHKIILTDLTISNDAMPQYRRFSIAGGTYFFTVVTYRRRPILCDAPVRAALRNAIQTVRARYPFTINAWVLLPDHLHCLWTLPPDDANFAKRWALIMRPTVQAGECVFSQSFRAAFIRVCHPLPVDLKASMTSTS